MTSAPGSGGGGTASGAKQAVLLAAALALLAYLLDVLLLVFAAVLLALVLLAPVRWLEARTGWRHGWCLGLVLFVLTAALAAAAWRMGAVVAAQFGDLSQKLPDIAASVRQRLGDIPLPGVKLDPSALMPSGGGGGLLGRGVRALNAAFGAFADIGIVLFAAVLVAIDPGLYARGFVHLWPRRRRQRMGELLQELGATLQRWVLGQLLLMLFVGGASVIGLLFLDIPYAIALGVLAGVLTFIPFLGPTLAAILAIAVALTEGGSQALAVAALYLGIQIAEGALEPFVQQRTVLLPPALLIVAQVVMSALAGLPGVILATPLAAVTLVVVRRLYVEDVLEKEPPGGT